MPLSMDINGHIEALTTEGPARAHASGLKPQYGVTQLREWFDEQAGKVAVWLKRQ